MHIGGGGLRGERGMLNFNRFSNKNAKKQKIGDPLAILYEKPLYSLPPTYPPTSQGFWQKSELPSPLDFQPVCIHGFCEVILGQVLG